MIWVLFYYNSLPDMPEGCSLFSNDIMHRDFFKCNPTNTGHYQYPKFETLSYDAGCHCRQVVRFLQKEDCNKYVMFYTRHTALKGSSINKIVGYFKVGEEFESPRKGFRASESVLLPKNKCIKINYTSRGVPVSWGKSSIKNEINEILHNLKTEQFTNISDRYQKETEKITDRLQTSSMREEIITICEECKFRNKCYWGKKTKTAKKKTLNELYGNVKTC